MSVKKFKFVSPGIFVDEIDKSILPETSIKRGPLVIGRSERGPSMRPTRVDSFAEFVTTFGNPIPGGRGGDVWRDGNYTSTTYASYAAQAYLRNNSPVTFVRLLGSIQNEISADTDATTPGWFQPNHTTGAAGGAYGLYLFDSGSTATTVNGTLGAIWYANSETALTISGTFADSTATTSSVGALLKSQGANREFKLQVWAGGAGDTFTGPRETISFNFNPQSQKFIRKVFNTNPTLCNSTMIATAQLKNYWLGESYENVLDVVSTGTGCGGVLTAASSSTGNTHGVLLVMETNDGLVKQNNYKRNTAESKAGWVIAQDLGDSADFNPNNAQRLFRFSTLNSGEWDSKNIKVSIQDISFSNNEIEPFGSFTVLVRSAWDNDSSTRVLERYEDCSLDPASANYIARMIGD